MSASSHPSHTRARHAAPFYLRTSGAAPLCLRATARTAQVRAGDVMDQAKPEHFGGADYHSLTAEQVLAGEVPTELQHYVYPLAYYEGVVCCQLPSHIRLGYIVAGAQYKSDRGWPISTAYINGVRDFFVSKGFRMRVIAGRNPDDDLIFMGQARHFVQGGGGYSAVVAGVVSEMGGEVHWDGHPA